MAEIIKDHYERAGDLTIMNVVAKIAYDFQKIALEDNPLFAIDKFWKACGIGLHTYHYLKLEDEE